jgi:hypothetical protein
MPTPEQIEKFRAALMSKGLSPDQADEFIKDLLRLVKAVSVASL